jgi:hypothetical protein
MRGLRLIGAATMAVALAACSGVGSSFSVANGTTIPVTIVVNGATVETVPPGTTENPIKASIPGRPWTVEARSPSGRVLTTMTVAANDQLSNTSGRVGSADLACGRLTIWAGAPVVGEPTFIPDPSQPCD